jgi:thiamine biosynthesis protein ThiI
VDVILVRYAEVGLKSRGVRTRFERVLVDNMMSLLVRDGVEALVRSDQGRIYVETDQVERACQAVRRVFGVASVSPAWRSSSDMGLMRDKVAEIATSILPDRSTFKIEARRTGTHAYTSMDAARSLGEAVLMAHEARGVKVDIHHPDRTIWVEIRDDKAYIFTDYLDGPGGLPMGSQGRVLARLERERDALAAWMIMKRGCKVIALAEGDNDAVRLARLWDPDMRVEPLRDMEQQLRSNRASALVFGYGIEDMERIKGVHVKAPVFYPLVGMPPEEIEMRLQNISSPRGN